MSMSIRRLAALALTALLALAAFAAAEDAAPLYVENEWNFVEGSLDASNGIPDDAEGALFDIAQTGVLRVATEPYFPPQEFIDPALTGQDAYVGADMALARRIAERMGVALQIVPMEFSEVLDAVASGRCHLAISALSYTPGRAAQTAMSKGYYYTVDDGGSALMIREDCADAIRGTDDLAGRDIVAQAGSLQEMLLAQNAQHYHEFRRLSQISDVYDAVAGGEADAAMVDADSGSAYARNNPDSGLVLVSGLRFTLDEVYAGDRVAAKKGELQLIYFVNGVIDEVLESGEYLEWYAESEALAARIGAQ